MNKYIDADKVLAEIERRLKIVEPHKDTFESAAACRQDLIWMKDFINSLQQEQPEVDLFERPETPIKDAVEVVSRLRYIDEDLKPIAEFIMDYASWNLHKDEWNQPTIEVPLFRVLDALAQRGKPYCCSC